MEPLQNPTPYYPTLPDDEEPSNLDVAPDGTDLTLIRWMISLSYEERLEVLIGHSRMVFEVWSQNEIVSP